MRKKLSLQDLTLAAIIALLMITLSACSKKPKSPTTPAVGGNEHKKIEPVSFTDVKITDDLWSKRIEKNRTVTIPAALERCEESGRIDNFRIAAGVKQGQHRGRYPFDDTDVYKVIEGAAYSLSVHPDPQLSQKIDGIIETIAAAQEIDGYLFTARTNKDRGNERLADTIGQERWINVAAHSHELYNMGHLYEAAVAYYEATGKDRLLGIATKNADMLCEVFGPGKNESSPGHQIIEMGLARLYKATGEKKYLDLAKFFLDNRGPDGEEYSQSHKKVSEQDEVVGHAVRAMYMYSGMADVAELTGDDSYVKAIDRLWENMVSKKMYITGGIGSDPTNEGFGPEYDLPNMSAYCETCASIGNVYFNQRLFQLHGDGKYIDVLERVLYNALSSGVSLDGDTFFYPNALASRGQHKRSKWFDCACCPGNITRFMASVPGYIYAQAEDSIYVNLYVASEGSVKIKNKTVLIEQQTKYPWDGKVNITITPESKKEFSVFLRIPGWARNEAVPSNLYKFKDIKGEKVTIKVNGETLAVQVQNGYAQIKRQWKANDTIELDMPMPVRRVIANENVKYDVDKIALQRGPVIYCLEWPDVSKERVLNLVLPDSVTLSSDYKPQLIKAGSEDFGMGVITGKAAGLVYKNGEVNNYIEEITAIPYYAWSHRGSGEMMVWIPTTQKGADIIDDIHVTQTATVTAKPEGIGIEAINDLVATENSSDISVPLFSFWPEKGTQENNIAWIQYDFKDEYEPSIVDVFWVIDEDNQLPKSWKVQYKDKDDEWQNAWSPDDYPLAANVRNRFIFETVRTKSLRIVVELQNGYSAGLFEWYVK